MSSIIKKSIPHLIAIFSFIIINIIYFYPQIQGKVILSGDTVSNQGMSKEIQEYSTKTGETVLWTNAMFGGMPAYQIGVANNSNKIKILEQPLNLFFSRPIGYFNALMIGSYLLFVLLGFGSWISIIGAVCFGFMSNHAILFEAGHMTKIRAIAEFAPIIAGVILTFRKKYLLGGSIFAAAMALNIYANHFQMTYYLGMVLAIYVFIEIYDLVRQKYWKHLFVSSGILLFGLILALGSSASNLWTTYEYSKDTMRGKPILENNSLNNQEVKSSSEVDGLEWNYAMQWSNGIIDILAGVVPGIAGGGSSERISSDSAIAKDLRAKGANINRAPLYWGALPFTSGPVYFGIIMVYLFILGLLIVPGKLKWWCGIGVLMTLLISMGKNLASLNHVLFDYLPLFNKFRAHTSITGITGILIALLAVMTLSYIVNPEKDKNFFKNLRKPFLIASGTTLIFTLLTGLIGASFLDFSNPGDSRLVQSGWDLSAIISDRQALLQKDAFRSALFIGLSAGLIWLFLSQKINKWILIGSIGFLSVIDVMGISQRYLNHESFVSSQNYSRSFEPRPVDTQIKSQEPHRGSYRVYDLSINTFNSSSTSYFHNTIGGYHAAKLQRYQDLIDRHISKGNMPVLNMLNTKYIINQQGQAQQNPGAIGNAWFVESIQKVSSPNEEINALTGLDPASTAVILDSEFDNYLNTFHPQKNGSISLIEYSPSHLTYSSSTTSEQLAVFSEIWYGTDKGWNAYIDGSPVKHIRANYVLRAMRIPTGDHKVEFKFEPRTYYMGQTISLVSSFIILVSFIGFLFFEGFKKYHTTKENSLVSSKNKAKVRGKKNTRKR